MSSTDAAVLTTNVSMYQPYGLPPVVHTHSLWSKCWCDPLLPEGIHIDRVNFFVVSAEGAKYNSIG